MPILIASQNSPLNVVDVNALMTHICDQFNSHLDRNNLTLHTNFEDTLPSLLGDADELHRAITNLIEMPLITHQKMVQFT